MIAISELARRSGVAASALRFYETQGLLRSTRTSGGRRAFDRGALRRVAFIRAAQAIGLTLEEVRAVFASLPDDRTPTKADWAEISGGWRPLIQARITKLEALRDALDGCIGCGCLSLSACKLFNPEDVAKRYGPGARYLLGDAPQDRARGRAKGRQVR